MNNKKTVCNTKFEIPFDNKVLKGDHSKRLDNSANILFLHGAGRSNRDRFALLRKYLDDLGGVSSTAFDYFGHGESAPNPEVDSLAYRTNQAKSVIDNFCQTKPFSILAASMSAYVAIRLCALYPVESLILFVPAVYNRNAYHAQFGSDFTQIIRRDYSWVNSDAWEILESFTGKLLIIAAEQDEVIPREVVEYIYHASINASSRTKKIIPKSSHQILSFINERDEYLKQLSQEIYSLVNS